MTFGIPGNIPLGYLGANTGIVPLMSINHIPTVLDRKYPIGQFFIIGREPLTGVQGALYYLSEFDSSGDPIWTKLIAGTGAIESVTLSDATVIIPTGNNINLLQGSGTSVTGSASTITITSHALGMAWSVITAATKTIVVGNGYFANRAGLVTFTLPATAIVGDTFGVSLMNGSGSFAIAQNSGQTIRVGSHVTTTGVGGSLASTGNGDAITLICTVANTDFQAVIPPMGNLTIV